MKKFLLVVITIILCSACNVRTKPLVKPFTIIDKYEYHLVGITWMCQYEYQDAQGLTNAFCDVAGTYQVGDTLK